MDVIFTNGCPIYQFMFLINNNEVIFMYFIKAISI
jgi:hypothetical protein